MEVAIIEIGIETGKETGKETEKGEEEEAGGTMIASEVVAEIATVIAI